MRTLLRKSWITLRRDRIALALTFVLPIAFFTIFASIFAGSNNGGAKVQAIQVLVADMDESAVSTNMIDSLAARSEIDVVRAITTEGEAGEVKTESSTDEKTGVKQPIIVDGDAARAAVRGGKYDAALVVPAGFGTSFPDFAGDGPSIQLYYDAANPIARPSIVGLLQAAAFQTAPDLMMDRGLELLETSGLGFTDEQNKVIESAKESLRALSEKNDANTGEAADADDDAMGGMASFVRVDASPARTPDASAEANKRHNRMISYYAASIGVMFLLFSTTGAAGSLLDEQEAGTLDRLLSSNLTMNHLLASEWTFYSLMGFMQLTLMFLWGRFVFGLDLFTANHVAGGIIVAMVTAGAAAAFGMLLATLSRTRAQMNGISTIIILAMSAIGGSMIPRFFMPLSFQQMGKFTFNGWAIDGFLKVFWYDNPADSVIHSVLKLWPEVLVLLLMTAAFMVVARLSARRWEAV